MSSKSRLEILGELNEVGEKIDKYTANYPKRRKNEQLKDIETRMNGLRKEIKLPEDSATFNRILDKLVDWYMNPEFARVYTKRRPKFPKIEPIEPIEDLVEKEMKELVEKEMKELEELLGKMEIKKDEEPSKKEEEKKDVEMEISREEALEIPEVQEMMEKQDREAMEEEELETRKRLGKKGDDLERLEEMEEKKKEEEEEMKEEMKEEEAEVKMEEAGVKAEELSMEEIHNNIRKEEREKVMREFNLVDPTIGTIDIPKERLGVEGKTLKILNDDIKYFINRFPDMLKIEADVYKKTNKKNKKALEDIHRRIQAKLSPDKKEEEGQKVGIILDADKFIDMKISEILATKTLEGLTPANLVDITEEPKSQGRDVGSYTITRNRQGRDVINNAPVYRSIPTTQPQQPKRKAEIKQETIYKNTAMDKVDIARMEMRDNPFIRKQMAKPLNIIL
jgi:hypothetical protein